MMSKLMMNRYGDDDDDDDAGRDQNQTDVDSPSNNRRHWEDVNHTMTRHQMGRCASSFGVNDCIGEELVRLDERRSDDE